jgi:hypothetical protein
VLASKLKQTDNNELNEEQDVLEGDKQAKQSLQSLFSSIDSEIKQ